MKVVQKIADIEQQKYYAGLTYFGRGNLTPASPWEWLNSRVIRKEGEEMFLQAAYHVNTEHKVEQVINKTEVVI